MPPHHPIQSVNTIVLPVAHGGHLLVDLPVFLGPIVVIVLWLLLPSRRRYSGERDRRR
jgi:hypothetical protein